MLEKDDPAFFQNALDTIARTKGMQGVADKAKATRAGLYKALSTEGNPEFATVYRVISALDYRLAVVSQKKAACGSKPLARKQPLAKGVAAKKSGGASAAAGLMLLHYK